MTAVVEEERVIRLCVFYEPVHCPEDVAFLGLRHLILLVVCQDHHVFSGIAKVLVKVSRHVFDVVDATTQLSTLAEVVNANEKSFAFSCAVTRKPVSFSMAPNLIGAPHLYLN